MAAQLYITETGRPDRIIAVRRTATIGRDNENDIVLETITVSRWHAVLFYDAAGLLLADMESTNGTWVNDVLVQPDEPVRLADEDMIRFGQVVARYTVLPEQPGHTPAHGRLEDQPQRTASVHQLSGRPCRSRCGAGRAGAG